MLNLIYDTENLLLLLVGIGIGLVLTIVFFPVIMPRLAPFIVTSPSCSNLAAPSGGNSRSVLSFEGDATQKLEVDVRVVNETVVQGEPLRVEVTLKNNDVGPIILYMPQIEELGLTGTTDVGVSLEIQNVATGGPAQQIYHITTTTITYDSSTLHLLRAHNQCHAVYELDTGLGAGEYSILAKYTNFNAGPQDTSVPAPIFPDRGVWDDGEVASREERFTINLPPPPTAIPVQ